MNKIHKRKQVKIRRLQQAKNKELNVALNMLYTSGVEGTDFNAVEVCKVTSNRVLNILSKREVELLGEGVSITNKAIFEAARNELLERTVLKAKGHAKS